MTDKALEEFIAEAEAADDYLQEWKLRAKRIKMPSDPNAWLDKIESRLFQSLQELPDDVASEFSALITAQTRRCRHELLRDDTDGAKVAFAVLAANIERLNDNTAVHKINTYRKQRVDASRKERPGARSELRSKVVNLMAKDRAAGMSFLLFIEKWELGPLDGLRITACNDGYLVEDEDSSEYIQQKYKFSTLKEKLWPEAKAHR